MCVYPNIDFVLLGVLLTYFYDLLHPLMQLKTILVLDSYLTKCLLIEIYFILQYLLLVFVSRPTQLISLDYQVG